MPLLQDCVIGPDLQRVLDLEKAHRVAKRLLGHKIHPGQFMNVRAGQDLEAGYLLEKNEGGDLVRWTGKGSPIAISISPISKGNYGFVQTSNV